MPSQKLEMRRIFIIFHYSRSQFRNKICGRPIVFLSHRSCRPSAFLLLIMDEYTISFLGLIENCKQYDIIIGNFPTCICINFVSMMTSSLGYDGKCKHLYYILQNVMFCGLVEMSFIIQLGTEIKFIN
jgi:hypothetical protein